jgi:hypothetical protein
MDYDKNTVTFDMNCILDCLKNISSKSFNELVNEKAASNIKNWILRNPNHKFPKSKNSWLRLLESQFSILVVKINPEILLNCNYDLKTIHFQLDELKNKIVRFMKKKKNEFLLKNNRNKLINIVTSFSRIKYKVNIYELFDKLIKLSIIDSFSFTLYKKNKRKRDELADINEIYDDSPIELEISSFNNVKKIKISDDR